jgi:hypothetical protein
MHYRLILLLGCLLKGCLGQFSYVPSRMFSSCIFLFDSDQAVV